MWLKKRNLYLCIILCIFLFNMNIFALETTTEQSWYLKYNSQGTAPTTPNNGEYEEKYDIISLDKSGEKTIYLTFDAGYENGNVSKTVEILKENNVKGAFFVLPHLIKSYPELIKKIHTNGNLICNHTFSHKNMAKVKNFDEFAYELAENEKVLEETTGLKCKSFIDHPKVNTAKKIYYLQKNSGAKLYFGLLLTLTGTITNRCHRKRLLIFSLPEFIRAVSCFFIQHQIQTQKFLTHL